MILKRFGCTAIHNKERYINASFIHSFIRSFVHSTKLILSNLHFKHNRANCSAPPVKIDPNDKFGIKMKTFTQKTVVSLLNESMF